MEAPNGPVRGEIVAVRYHRGVPFIRARILQWSGNPSDKLGGKDWITTWAEPCMPWGTQWYGGWFSPKPGEKVWILFENGDIHKPIFLGYVPSWDRKNPGNPNDWDMPFEFDNENYLNKFREAPDRELPPQKHPEIYHAGLIKSPLGQFLLLHDKTKHAVIRGEDKVEIGEGAIHPLILGDRFKPRYNNHTHQNTVPPVEEENRIDDDVLSQYAFILHDKNEQPPPRIAVAVAVLTQQFTEGGGGGGGGGGGESSEGQSPQDIVDSLLGIAEDLGIDTSAVNDFLGLANNIISAFGDWLSGLGEMASNLADQITNWVVQGLEDLLGIKIPDDLLPDIQAAIGKLLRGDLSGALEALGQIVQNLVGAATQWVQEQLSNFLENTLSQITGAIAQQAATFLSNLLGTVVPVGAITACIDAAMALAKGDVGAALSNFMQAAVQMGLSSIPGGQMLAGVLASVLTGLGGQALAGAIAGMLGG